MAFVVGGKLDREPVQGLSQVVNAAHLQQLEAGTQKRHAQVGAQCAAEEVESVQSVPPAVFAQAGKGLAMLLAM